MLATIRNQLEKNNFSYINRDTIIRISSFLYKNMVVLSNSNHKLKKHQSTNESIFSHLNQTSSLKEHRNQIEQIGGLRTHAIYIHRGNLIRTFVQNGGCRPWYQGFFFFNNKLSLTYLFRIQQSRSLAHGKSL